MERIRRIRNKTGFTLVEVVIVLVIISIIAAIAAPSISRFVDSANRRNCIVETERLVGEIRTALTTTRINPDDDNLYKNANQAVLDVVSRYTEYAVAVETDADGYFIQTYGICDNYGFHTIRWNYTPVLQKDGKVLTCGVELKYGCDFHGETETMNCEIVFRYPVTIKNTPVIDFPTAVMLVEKLCDWAIDYTYSYVSGKMNRDFVAYLTTDSVVSQYITQDDLDKFATYSNSISKSDLVTQFINDYLFNTVWKPTLTYNGTQHTIYRRLYQALGDPQQSIYIVTRGEGKKNQAIFVSYRGVILNDEFTWFKVNNSNGFVNVASFGSQLAINARIFIAGIVSPTYKELTGPLDNLVDA